MVDPNARNGTKQSAVKSEEGSPSGTKSCSESSGYTWVSEPTGCESEEEEESFLPSWIRDKIYLKDSSRELDDAEKQLWADLEAEDLLEETFIKHIFIDTETGKPYVEMPSMYHRGVIHALERAVNSQSTMTDPVLVQTQGSIKLKGKVQKDPDILIYGPDRTENVEDGRKIRRVNRKWMNPNAIIEVSWTNKLEDEKRKFCLTMKKHKRERGIIKVGYLIKFIPKYRNMYPLDDDDENPADRPLVGIDVYRMESSNELGDQDQEPTMVQEFTRVRMWRFDEDDPEDYLEDFKITAEELGQGGQGEGVSFSFKSIVDELTELGVVFEAP